jgi:hypothetical protein
MRIKPTEVRLVAALLEEEHPDAESLAREIITRLDEKRMSDPMYILGTMLGDIPLIWGPFATANQASKAASKLAMPVALPGRVMQVKRIEDV